MWHTWGRREMRARFWWGNLKERDQDVGIDVRMIIEFFSVK
jgi:hypothetical protein